ncbi:MAG: tetratricopeptide repeat protein [Pirellula sp.]
MTDSEIFSAACSVSAESRELFLLEHCSGNEALKARILSYWQERDRQDATVDSNSLGTVPDDRDLDVTSSLLDGPADPSATDVSRPPKGRYRDLQFQPGDCIGPFFLQSPLGRGGMGEVWTAQQLEPVTRRVALKVIRRGIGSQEVISRFELERQALAMMNHPNIAQILDVGETPDGQPYFAMELVQGQPLTVYCDEHKLSVDERLKLFIDVCNGVQHAHQKGIIHRDLKPGNILVTVIDGQPVPKVIDFGLAKAMATDQSLEQQTLFTGIGQVLGTLKYMSPEQAGLDSLDIDTRTDIYSLGVILYELLTGSTPLDDASIQGKAILKVLELVREQEASKPSSKLDSNTDEVLSGITGRRQIDSLRLKRILLGDLDWIVMKSLEKDRGRRYDSVSGFAADIRRYLQDEPVTARPPSFTYRVQKFVRKNRVAATAASLVAASLIAGIVVSSVALFRALEAEKLAAQRLQDALDAKREAERNLAYAKRGNQVLGSVFANLDPKAEYATIAELRNALRDNLQSAVSELEGTQLGDALTVADLQITLAHSMSGLGDDNQAIELFERSRQTLVDQLDEDDPDLLTSADNLGRAYMAAGDLDRGLRLLEETLEKRRSKLGEDHLDTIQSMFSVGGGYFLKGQFEKALPLLQKSWEVRKQRLGPDHADTLSSLNNLATLMVDMKQPEAAIPLHKEAVEMRRAKLGPDHPLTLVSVNNLGLAYQATDEIDEAIVLFEENLELRKKRLGESHPATLTSMNNLALAYLREGNIEQAKPIFQQTLQMREAILGVDHPNTLTNLHNLARIYREQGDFSKALALYKNSLDRLKAKLGAGHPSVILYLEGQAITYRAMGQINKALPLMEEAVERSIEQPGPDHPETLSRKANLAAVYWSAKQLDRSIPLFEEVMHAYESKLGRSDYQTQFIAANLGVNYSDAGRLDEAIALLEEVRQANEQYPQLDWAMDSLATAYQKANRNEAYLEIAKERIDKARQRLPKGSLELAAVLIGTADDCIKLMMFDMAIDLLREGLKIRKRESPDAWNRYSAESMLGGALLGQAKSKEETGDPSPLMREAEQCITAGYAGMKAREDKISAQGKLRMLDAIDRMIELHVVLGSDTEAEKFRAMRQEYADKE